MFDEWYDLPDLLDNVQELLELGLIEEAETMLDKYETVFGDEWEYHFLCSRLLTDKGRPRDAIPHLIRGLRIDPQNVDCWLGMFYAFSMMNRVKCGGKFLLAAEKKEPHSEPVLSALIWYYTETNEPQKAVAYFERAQNIFANNPDTYRNAGIAFDRLSRFAEAEACYKAALMICPTFEDARDLYAEHLLFTGNIDGAVKVYEDALRESPKNIRHISKLIYCLSQAGNFDKAEQLARHSITLYPNTPLGYIDLAYVFLNTNDLEKTIEQADLAINIAPLDAEGYRVKAIACSERGDYEIASDLFKHSITLDPENTDIMRDYYKHLQLAGDVDLMERTAHEVIASDHPYCTEDYWFLADFYRDRRDHLKAFRYLRLAYATMPAEKELLVPMIEILIEQNHKKFALPLFSEYVEKGGWTNSANALAASKHFADRETQEGLRFLRFTGVRPKDFRAFIFNRSLRKVAIVYYTIIMAAFSFPLFLFFGWRGVAGCLLTYAMTFVIFFLVKKFRKKNHERENHR